jgi:hypothetical protein
MGPNAFGCQNYFQYEEHQEGLDPKGEIRSPMDFGEFEGLAKFGCISWGASHWIMPLPSGLVLTKYRQQSTEGYAHDGRLCGRGTRDQELDGNTSTRTQDLDRFRPSM